MPTTPLPDENLFEKLPAELQTKVIQKIGDGVAIWERADALRALDALGRLGAVIRKAEPMVNGKHQIQKFIVERWNLPAHQIGPLKSFIKAQRVTAKTYIRKFTWDEKSVTIYGPIHEPQLFLIWFVSEERFMQQEAFKNHLNQLAHKMNSIPKNQIHQYVQKAKIRLFLTFAAWCLLITALVYLFWKHLG